MNSKQFKKWLTAQGATFVPGKGGHLKVTLALDSPDGIRGDEPVHDGRHQEAIGLEGIIMINLNYPVHLKVANEGSITVTFPQVPEAITQGDDEGEALANAVDALETALSFYIDAGTDLPKAGKGRRTVRPSALGCIKLSIYQAMREQGVKKSELARRLGWHMPQVDRLLDLMHASRLDQAEAALQSLGHTLEVSVSAVTSRKKPRRFKSLRQVAA